MLMILSKDLFIEKKESYLKQIKKGAVFIYPTDTIYGIGCNALDDSAVKRIRKLKKRPKKPFSVIAPSKKWITDNCKVRPEQLDRLPGPYTYVLEVKSRAVSERVNPGSELLGVRIPKNWFTEIVKVLGLPVVTTSVNITGKDHMTSLQDLDEEFKNSVDFIIYDGKKEGNPSTIFKINNNRTQIIKR